MASIAIMIGGAVVNAAAFTGGNYLAKYIAGDSGKAALEAYQNAMDKYTRERTQLLDWIETNREIKAQADQNFTNTDYAFKLYNQAHPDYKLTLPTKPTCISQVSCRNRASFFLSAGARLRLVTQLFVFFEHFFALNKWTLNSPKSTTAHKAIGKASLQSKNWQTLLKCLKM